MQFSYRHLLKSSNKYILHIYKNIHADTYIGGVAGKFSTQPKWNDFEP